MMEKRKSRLTLGEILLRITSLTPEQLKDALSTQQKKKMVIGKILVEKGYVTEQDVLAAMVIQDGYPYINLSNYHIDSELTRVFSREFVQKYKLIPLEKIGNSLTVAVISSFDRLIIKDIEEKYSYKIRIFWTTLEEIEEAIKKYY